MAGLFSLMYWSLLDLLNTLVTLSAENRRKQEFTQRIEHLNSHHTGTVAFGADTFEGKLNRIPSLKMRKHFTFSSTWFIVYFSNDGSPPA